MNIVLQNHSGYPRIGEGPGQQRHRQAYARLERKEISPEEWEKVCEEITAEILKEQEEAGLDLLTDGQVRWYDPVSHIAGKLSGLKINGLLRFFDTNFFVRQPVVEGEIQRKGPILLPEYEKAKGAAGKPVKAVLTGPLTLARHSILSNGADFNSLVKAYALCLSKEMVYLAAAGCPLLQVDEPSLLRHPEDWPALKEALAEFGKAKGKAKLYLSVYWADVSAPWEGPSENPPKRVWEHLLQAAPSVDGFVLDFTYSPGLADQIAGGGWGEKDLILGIFDGRNVRMETEKEIAEIMEKVSRSGIGRAGAEIGWSPSCSLEYLPRDAARKKLERMSALRKKLAAAAG